MAAGEAVTLRDEMARVVMTETVCDCRLGIDPPCGVCGHAADACAAVVAKRLREALALTESNGDQYKALRALLAELEGDGGP